MLAKPKTDTKQVDSKGRITLGRRFINRMVMVEEVDSTEVRITMARVIPEREAWLYDNPKAKKAVFAGIEQARSNRLLKPKSLKRMRRIAPPEPAASSGAMGATRGR